MSSHPGPTSPPGPLFFQDARSCKDWLKTIPTTNIAQAQQLILDSLRMFARAHTSPMERLTCMELLRERVAFLIDEQRQRYAGKMLPLSHTENAAWNVARTLLQEMENGYRRCSKDAIDPDSGLKTHAALIIQRIMRYIGLQMLIAGFIYRRFDTALWMRLHTQWREAEDLGLTTGLVKDSVGTMNGKSSILQAYTAVLLAQAVNIYELTPREIDFVDAVLKRFGHKVKIDLIPMVGDTRNTDRGVCTVDLLSSLGCEFLVEPDVIESRRFLDMAELSKSLRRRLHGLAEGIEPGTLDLPAAWSASEALALLTRLHRVWCLGDQLQPPATVPDEVEAIVTFGITETHYFLSGMMFEQPDVKRGLSRQEINDIAMFGKVSEATTRARYADFNYFTESWGLIEEGKSLVRLLRPANSNRGVAIGKLVGIKIGNTDVFYLGVIHEIYQEADGNIFIRVDMLPGRPEATAVRSTELKGRSGNSYTQGFRLPPLEGLSMPETLIVPSGIAKIGQDIDIYLPAHGKPKPVTLTEFIERGIDFDRVRID